MAEHTLKCWPEFYDAIADGRKTFEARRNDRGFQTGDTLRLQRTKEDNMGRHRVDYDANGRVKHEQLARVTYLAHGERFGIMDGFCMMAIERIPAKATP
jgi:YD repeat-containing protein